MAHFSCARISDVSPATGPRNYHSYLKGPRAQHYRGDDGIEGLAKPEAWQCATALKLGYTTDDSVEVLTNGHPNWAVHRLNELNEDVLAATGTGDGCPNIRDATCTS